MRNKVSRLAGQKGFVLVYMAGALTCLLLFTGVAVDSGRAYMVKAQLTKAVDGAALAAARNLNSGSPADVAGKIYRANFPAGYMGTTSSTNPGDAGFFTSTVDEANGVNIVYVRATAVLPTTFMKLGTVEEVTVYAEGEAQRRMVDLSLVLDVSSSIGPAWGAVRDASRSFINAFDQVNDRLSLATFGNGAQVLDQMPSTRGFAKSTVMSHVPNTLPGGSTNMVEGLYRAWDELRSVPAGTQSGLRIIVLFTDGASNSVPGNFGAPGRALRTFDFPQNPGDTHGQTWNSPQIAGLYNTGTGAGIAPTFGVPWTWDSHSTPPVGTGSGQVPAHAQWLPATSSHVNHRSSGIPTSFPLQTNALMVDGVAQSTERGLRDAVGGVYPAQVWNINNAARNLVEIISDAARAETTGDYRVRIYTIGMGQMVRLELGTRPETPESILMRIANDRLSPDYNPAQLEGKYFYAETAGDVAAAFAGIQNQILRLSK
jgi:Flp pilus assembly protein TadG